MDHGSDDQEELKLAKVHWRVQADPLPPPLQNPELLPLRELEPKVFERVVAEIVAREDNRGVQIYGRSGQSQYGLDIVAREPHGARSLYQVKRFQQLTGKDLRAAVRRYAGDPRPAGYKGEPRRFGAHRFVLATSAELDSSAEVVDTLAALQDEYEGDLEVEAWGAEALSRILRDAPHLVYAVFGPEWARMFCGGFEPSVTFATAPRPLGLVESPIEVLGLELTEADAIAAEAADPATAARLFGAVAQGLSAGGFPGHASMMRRRQAKALLASGDATGAFTTIFEVALNLVLAGWGREAYEVLRELEKISALVNDTQKAEYRTLACVAQWYEHGTKLAKCMPALRVLTADRSPWLAVLCCLILEQALVDGLYESVPAQSVTADVDEDTAAYLAELTALAAAADPRDIMIRARLRCAIADTRLPLDATSAAVGEVYDSILRDALAGRLRTASGLVTSRAAYAYAMHGDPERADDLWRRSVLTSSEHSRYGDVIGALRASRRLAFERSVFSTWPAIDTNALPNRDRLLSGAFDPALAALEAVHADKLPNAYCDTRRYIWESRLAGHLQDELHALALFGDVLATSGAATAAVEFYVRCDEAEKAVALARSLSELVDVDRWLASPVRRCRGAAVQVIGAQAAIVNDASVPGRVDALLRVAAGVWEARTIHPQPELEALRAIAAFALRIPASAVDTILDIAGPALTAATLISEDVANLLAQTYWAAEGRRSDLAEALLKILRLPDPPRSLWARVWNMPAGAREPLLPGISAMADTGSLEAIAALASWRIPTAEVQRIARQMCAALLRWPVAEDAGAVHLGSFDSHLAEFLLTALEAADPVPVSLSELGPELDPPVVEAHFTVTRVAGTPEDEVRAVEQAGESALLPALRQDDSADPDDAALIAAGPLDELVTAVAVHLVAMAKDGQRLATGRLSILHVLRSLIPKVPADTAAGLATALAELHRAPSYSEMDLLEMGTNHALSRTRINSGAYQLPAVALLAAAEMYSASRKSDTSVTDDYRKFADQSLASATKLLRDQDPWTRRAGGLVVMILSVVHDEFGRYATGLLFHNDEYVREIAAADAPLTASMLSTLATDNSTVVRTALARRGSALPEAARKLLSRDPHLLVRHTLAHSELTT